MRIFKHLTGAAMALIFSGLAEPALADAPPLANGVPSTEPIDWAALVSASRRNNVIVVDLPKELASWWRICRTGLTVDAVKYKIEVLTNDTPVPRTGNAKETATLGAPVSCALVHGHKIQLNIRYVASPGTPAPADGVMTGTYQPLGRNFFPSPTTGTVALAPVQLKQAGTTYKPSDMEREGLLFHFPENRLAHVRVCSLDAKNDRRFPLAQNRVLLNLNQKNDTRTIWLPTGHKSCFDMMASAATAEVDLVQMDNRYCHEYERNIALPGGSTQKAYNCSALLQYTIDADSLGLEASER